MSTLSTEDTRLAQRWERFRVGRNEALASDHGWLTLTSFHWLGQDPQKFDAVPGLWSVSDGAAVLTASAEDGFILLASGAPVEGELSTTLSDEESIMWVAFGSVVVELGMRANRYMIRTRDSLSPVLTGFRGVPVFDYDPSVVVEGKFEPYAEPRSVAITTAHPEVPGTARLVGDVVLSLHGTQYRLAAEEGKLGSLVVTFFDASNNVSTAHWRKLELTRPRPDGSVVVDFNRAINFPSAFTDFGTCPAPVLENRLDVAIEAGEKQPH